MAYRDEFMQAVAGGLLKKLYDELIAKPDINERRILKDRDAWRGWLSCESSKAMGHTVSNDVISQLYTEIPDMVYDVALREVEGRPSTPTGAGSADGQTIVCDSPGTGITTYVISWNSGTREWTEIGPLSTNSTPGAGNYVLVNRDDETDIDSINTQFIELTS